MSQLKNLTDDQIVAYIFSKLSEEEEDRIDDFLDQNMEYRISIDAMMDMCLKDNLEEHEFRELLKDISFNNIEEEILESNVVDKINTSKKAAFNIKRFFPVVSVAAVIALIIMVSIGAGFPMVLKVNEEIDIDRGSNSEKIIEESERKIYEKGKYAQFLKLNFTENELAYPEVRFYLGISALNKRNSNLDLAEQYLSSISIDDSHLYFEAQYYLAQVYLLKTESQKCLKCIDKVKSSNREFKLLKKLERKCTKIE